MSERTYFYITKEIKSPKGPYSLYELNRMVQMGELDEDARVAATGDTEWVALRTVMPELDVTTRPVLPPIPQQQLAAALPPIPRVGMRNPWPAAEVGPCPECGKSFPLDEAGLIPKECPHCRYLFRGDNPGGIMDNVKLVFRKLFVLKGRATRAEYWYFYLFSYIVSMMFTIPLAILQFASLTPRQMMRHDELMFSAGYWETTAGMLQLAQFGISLVLIILNFSVSVRRLHDTGKSAFLLVSMYVMMPMIVLTLIGILGVSLKHNEQFMLSLFLLLAEIVYIFVAAILILIAYCTDSTAASNKYGVSPKYPTPPMR